MHTALIDQFEDGAIAPRKAIVGLSAQELLARPGPGDWSIQELVIHLTDSDAIAIDRMKRILTEDNPTLLCADEAAYVKRLHCDAQSIDDAVAIFELGRRQMSRILRRLNVEEFDRSGTHNVMGPVTLRGLLEGYIGHLEHHLTFLAAKRERLGKWVI